MTTKMMNILFVMLSSINWICVMSSGTLDATYRRETSVFLEKEYVREELRLYQVVVQDTRQMVRSTQRESEQHVVVTPTTLAARGRQMNASSSYTLDCPSGTLLHLMQLKLTSTAAPNTKASHEAYLFETLNRICLDDNICLVNKLVFDRRSRNILNQILSLTVGYSCLPVKLPKEIVCADSYMELSCSQYGVNFGILILEAIMKVDENHPSKLTNESSENVTTIPPNASSGNRRCPTLTFKDECTKALNVDEEVSKACNREVSCTINTNGIIKRQNSATPPQQMLLNFCPKYNMLLRYACVHENQFQARKNDDRQRVHKKFQSIRRKFQKKKHKNYQKYSNIYTKVGGNNNIYSDREQQNNILPINDQSYSQNGDTTTSKAEEDENSDKFATGLTAILVISGACLIISTGMFIAFVLRTKVFSSSNESNSNTGHSSVIDPTKAANQALTRYAWTNGNGIPPDKNSSLNNSESNFYPLTSYVLRNSSNTVDEYWRPSVSNISEQQQSHPIASTISYPLDSSHSQSKDVLANLMNHSHSTLSSAQLPNSKRVTDNFSIGTASGQSKANEIKFTPRVEKKAINSSHCEFKLPPAMDSEMNSFSKMSSSIVLKSRMPSTPMASGLPNRRNIPVVQYPIDEFKQIESETAQSVTSSGSSEHSNSLLYKFWHDPMPSVQGTPEVDIKMKELAPLITVEDRNSNVRPQPIGSIEFETHSSNQSNLEVLPPMGKIKLDLNTTLCNEKNLPELNFVMARSYKHK